MSSRSAILLEHIIRLRPSGNNYEIVSGSERFFAAKECGLSAIPARIQNIDDEDVRATFLMENLRESSLTAEEIEDITDNKYLNYNRLLAESSVRSVALFGLSISV